MRGALALLGVAAMLAGCPADPSRIRVVEAGVRDVGDFGLDAGALDGAPDAFSWPDTGPPLPPVLPAQSWEIALRVNGDPFVLTIDLDARAESGIVRAVAGAGGHSTSVVFDVAGGVLRARGPIAMGMPGTHTCGYDTVAVEQLELDFRDDDGDGVHESLGSAASLGLVTRTGAHLSPSSTFEAVVVEMTRGDTTPPVLALADPSPIAGVDPIVLLASEPIAPGFMPQLVGPRTLALRPDVGASAPARWTLDMRGLPAGHYDLVLGSEPRDLSGHVASSSPTLSLDVAALAPPPIDDVDPSVVFVASSAPMTILGDDPAETALLGTTSLLVTARTLVALDSPVGTHTISMLLRHEGPSGATTFSTGLWAVDETGVYVGQNNDYAYLSPPASVPGFDWEDPAHTALVPYVAAHAGRVYLAIDPGGPADPACLGMAPTPGIGLVIDQIVLM